MKDCRGIRERMQSALDGELAEADRDALGVHLAGCSECRIVWERLNALEGLLASAPVVAPPEGFSARVRSRIETAAPAHANYWGWVALAGGALVLAVVAALISMQWLGTATAWLAPRSWLVSVPLAVRGGLNLFGAIARGVYLLVHGVVEYAHFNWLLLGVATISLITGVSFVASHLCTESVSLRV